MHAAATTAAGTTWRRWPHPRARFVTVRPGTSIVSSCRAIAFPFLGAPTITPLPPPVNAVPSRPWSRGSVVGASRRHDPAGKAMKLLPAEELAARWQTTEAHVDELAREQAVPHVRLGRYVRFHPVAVEAFDRESQRGHRSSARRRAAARAYVVRPLSGSVTAGKAPRLLG